MRPGCSVSRDALGKLSAASWILIYAAAAIAVLVSVMWPGEAAWLGTVVFVACLASVVFQVVRASLTRRLSTVRLLCGINVVVLAALTLVRDEVSTRASAFIVLCVPVLSYFVFIGWRLAIAPPQPGEAMRPSKLLRECHPLNRCAVSAVLAVEFAQFNALSFNPALNAWADLPSLSSYFSYSFFVFPSNDDASYRQQLWGFCALAVGWVLFALVALAICRRRARDAAQSAQDAALAVPTHHLTASPHQGGGGAGGGSGLDVAQYTMSSPVILVVRTIAKSGQRAIHSHGRLLHRGREGTWHLLWCVRSIRPACVGHILLAPWVALLVLLGFGVAALLSFIVGVRPSHHSAPQYHSAPHTTAPLTPQRPTSIRPPPHPVTLPSGHIPIRSHSASCP